MTPPKRKPKVVEVLKKVAKAVEAAKRKRDEVSMPAPLIASPLRSAGPFSSTFQHVFGQ